MRISPLDLTEMHEGELDTLSEWVEEEKNRRRLASYPDDFARILGEGILGTDTKPLYALLEEYTKIIGRYDKYSYISCVEYDQDLGECELVVTRKTYQDQEYVSYNVPVAHLKNLDLARQEVAQRKEAMRLREMAQLEAKLKELRGAT